MLTLHHSSQGRGVGRKAAPGETLGKLATKCAAWAGVFAALGLNGPLQAQSATGASLPGRDLRYGVQLSGGARAATPRAVGTITGEGTAGSLAKFTGPNLIGNSVLNESSGKIGIGTAAPTAALTVVGAGGITIQATNTATTANAYGVLGMISSATPGPSSAGVRGVNNGTTSNGAGLYGLHAGAGAGVHGQSNNGYGVYGLHSATTGSLPGVYGATNSTDTYANGIMGVVNATAPGVSASGVRGMNNSTTANGYGVYGTHAGGGTGTIGGSVSGRGVYGLSTTGVGVYGKHNATTGASPGVYGLTNSSDVGANGVFGLVNAASSGIGSAGVRGANSGTGSNGSGVHGSHDGSGSGVYGTSGGGIGVFGDSASGTGVYGQSSSGLAGYFNGNVTVTGTLAKGAGTFKIDHPLDPANKYLSHSFVESPDMMNVYNGNVTTDAKGNATVQLPDYFQSLNAEYRYQLTCIGSFAQAIISQEIKNNRFGIKTNKPNIKVSWQVTGVRQDAYAKAHRVAVVEEKKGRERGAYLHPELFGQPQEKGIAYATRPGNARSAKTPSHRLARQAAKK